jgi:hypothetical protein
MTAFKQSGEMLGEIFELPITIGDGFKQTIAILQTSICNFDSVFGLAVNQNHPSPTNRVF